MNMFCVIQTGVDIASVLMYFIMSVFWMSCGALIEAAVIEKDTEQRVAYVFEAAGAGFVALILTCAAYGNWI